jgi:protein-tyrosine phosphatase
MLDLHCHILPGVDDGPATLDEALALARFAVADGITHITATPHFHLHTRVERRDVLRHVADFNRALSSAGIGLAVLPGCEVQVTNTTTYRRNFEEGLYCHLGDGADFTLLELPWSEHQCPNGVPGLVHWLRERGLTPILAHPERHNYVRNDPGRLRALVEAGAWLQVTVDSLLGNFGLAAREAGERVLREYPEVVLSTDAHNLGRCSGLSAGFAWVRQHLGEQRERDLRDRAGRVLERLVGARG